MEVKPIIEIKNLSKRYNITHQRGGYVALRDILANIMMSPFAFLKKKAKQVIGLETREEFWALKDLDLEVKRGEVIGIIGRNGAGKSTLLKILSQITPPTHGEIRIHGKVGSLLEVGTGFHPELSGRENIFLNGAILGMSRKEIAEKFDAIVEFAGIEKFLDTPVKYYSSGMYVRLAFSVAAHMEPDILIVDEVLAVGDAEFQKKCLGKMDEITKTEGRTILFVSHNMGAIRQLCNRTVLLEKGSIKDVGETGKIIDEYLKTNNYSEVVNLQNRRDRKGDGQIRLTKISFRNAKGEKVSSFKSGEEAQFWIEYENKNKNIDDFNLSMAIDSTSDSSRITTISNKYYGEKILLNKNLDQGVIKIIIEKLALNIGDYYLTLYVDGRGGTYDWIQKAATFSVRQGNYYGNDRELPQQSIGIILMDYKIK